MDFEVKQAIVMVGGQGTRLKPLTETKPKPILPVLDKPCLKYLIESLAEAGIKEVILACGYKSKQLEEAIGDGSDMGISIEYSYEDKPLGTGGAIKLIEDRLDEVFVAANGDTFADINIKNEIEVHKSQDAMITLALTAVKNPSEFGIVRLDDNGRIIEFKEKPKPEEIFSNLVNAGVYVVNKKVLEYIPADEFYDFSKDLFPLCLEKNYRLQGYILEGLWKDVGRPSDLTGVNLAMASRLYDDFHWGGKKIETSKVTKPFYMGVDCIISDSDISVSVILKNSLVKKSKITNSLIMSGCDISSATIENSILGDNCIVKPGAHIVNSVLRDGTIVKAGESVLDNKSTP